jgi:hypothetical protein
VYPYQYSPVALEEGGWSAPCPDCLTPGKEMWYPLCRRLVEVGLETLTPTRV